MPFFQQFPKIPYDFGSNGIDTNIVDLFRFVKANEQYFHEVATYIDYQIRDGERPDIVSNSLYGTPEYYWVFFLINEHLKNGISGWPMPEQELLEYIAEEYPGTTIRTYPSVARNPDGMIKVGTSGYPNSLSERFVFGETIFGSTSSARGIVISKNIQQSQLQAITLAQYRLTVAAPVAVATGYFVVGSTYKIVTAATPTVTIGGGNGTATAIPIISGATGSLTAIRITNPGTGVFSSSSLPSVEISGNGAGSGATATAIISATGVLTGFTIGSAGSGYTSFPGAATSTVGSVFTATGIGTGIGTAYPTYTPGESISMTLPNGTIRSALIFEVEEVELLTSLIVGYVSGSFTAGLTLTGPISKCSRAYVSIAQVNRNFQNTEEITGKTSGDKVESYAVYSSPDAPHHYLNADGLISYNSLHVDEQVINYAGVNYGVGNQAGTAEADLTAVSNRAYEIEVNEERSRIRIIHPDYIYKFVQLYYSLINKNAS